MMMSDRRAAFHAQMTRVRAKSSSELTQDGSAMPAIRAWVAETSRKIEFLPTGPGYGDVALEALQITARSSLGAVAYETGGIMIDDGWIRVLGLGSTRLARTIAGWNGLPCEAGDAYLPGAMFVADDVIGGMFAVDVGALGAKTRGNICYFDPRSRVWHDTNLGYGDWLHTMFVGGLAHYDDLRWEGWRTDVHSLPGTHAYSLVDGQRKPVTMRELRDALLAGRR